MNLTEIKKPQKLMSLPEAAKFIGVSYITMYRLVQYGKIKALNIAKSGTKPIFAFTPKLIQDYYDSLSRPAGIQPKEVKARREKKHKNLDQQDLRGGALGAEKVPEGPVPDGGGEVSGGGSDSGGVIPS